uniref:Uncharacterized protein n=1 Tax=Chromera velia CCMP2878 TaxID=1169474 RepID=A0A0G4FRT7_9ALVE|eukprot:Cvel_18443.t1-p1 / transcript=Cvel_18443.t1 / gene=Cvel_18443 / organism=Chromera_velia_CCMP2878 / gene_product=hypothetical protein / transcript_product=hypothetical protein / location=Cvel_scaffold1527:44220-44795(+) / protein_length=192 / sequence_SO=supercontig / SO=protein_coding / is_pseudo=false
MAGTPTLPPLLTFRGNGVGVDGSNGKKSRNLLKNVVAVVSPGGAMRPFHGSHPLVSLFLSLGVSAVVSVDLFMTAELPPRRNAHRIATQLENWYAENSEDLSLTEETVYVLCGYSTGGWMMTLLAGMQPRPVSLSFMKNILLAPIGTMLRPREGNHADLVLAFWTERYQRTDKERLKFMEANHGKLTGRVTA